MTEIRDRDGKLLGHLDMAVSKDQRYWRLAVHEPLSSSFKCNPDPSQIRFKTIDLGHGLWRDGKIISDIWLMTGGLVSDLQNCRHVFIAGATCETWWGKKLKFYEAIARLNGMLRFGQLRDGVRH